MTSKQNTSTIRRYNGETLTLQKETKIATKKIAAVLADFSHTWPFHRVRLVGDDIHVSTYSTQDRYFAGMPDYIYTIKTINA